MKKILRLFLLLSFFVSCSKEGDDPRGQSANSAVVNNSSQSITMLQGHAHTDVWGTSYDYNIRLYDVTSEADCEPVAAYPYTNKIGFIVPAQLGTYDVAAAISDDAIDDYQARYHQKPNAVVNATEGTIRIQEIASDGIYGYIIFSNAESFSVTGYFYAKFCD